MVGDVLGAGRGSRTVSMTATTATTTNDVSTRFAPGSLVRARGREWIVLGGGAGEVLRVRPVSGTEDDQTLIHAGLEAEPVTEASFPRPELEQEAGHDAALLLRDALLLSLRRGAGPFRGFGQIAVEPRAYQLVPLMMALRMETVRLLIADDVGVGKTIEAALIARELLDRGDIERMTVLCPPHLVDQWVGELEGRFHIRAVAVTAASANRLERHLPPGESVFSMHPATVVSLDYIKSERRRAEFLRACPEFVIVDEAHTCAATGPGRHQRYDLLRGLTESASRHLVMLTATPHSGDEAAFFRLLGLLDPDFQKLAADTVGPEREKLRDRLSRHFVQRRRPDIAEWQDGSVFPRRETRELTYKLTGAWGTFFDHVLDYCADVVEAAAGDERKQRLNFWGTLALMRCVASSPAAAVQALRTRAGMSDGSGDDGDGLEARIFDGAADTLPDDDVEPPAGSDDPALVGLIAEAETLMGQSGDPKLNLLTDHLRELVDQGFSPVVFCRYIATAHYLGRHLKEAFAPSAGRRGRGAAAAKDVTVGIVTGELTSDERKECVEVLGEAEHPILIATDCLSEGVNLQEHFDSVVHYDLSWNPTRHEQREGRVDRFGQERRIVRATLIYGANNPVDGAVLDVILRKAAKIREELGVPVPVPDDGHTLTQVLLKAVLLKRRGKTDAKVGEQMQLFDKGWSDAAAKAKANRTVFAQRRLKPDEVLPEWRKSLAAIGGKDDVQRFTSRALARLGAALEKRGTAEKPRGFSAPLEGLPEDVKERLDAEGLTGTVLIDFSYPPPPRCRSVQRSHPLVAVLAETLLERTLGQHAVVGADLGILGRLGCWTSAAVQARTVVALVRMRHQLITRRRAQTSTVLVEEATALAWTGTAADAVVEGQDALALLLPDPVGEPPANVRQRVLQQALAHIDGDGRLALDAFAQRRAAALLEDHHRVRLAGDPDVRRKETAAQTRVQTVLPADVIGLFVLLPRVD